MWVGLVLGWGWMGWVGTGADACTIFCTTSFCTARLCTTRLCTAILCTANLCTMLSAHALKMFWDAPLPLCSYALLPYLCKASYIAVSGDVAYRPLDAQTSGACATLAGMCEEVHSLPAAGTFKPAFDEHFLNGLTALPNFECSLCVVYHRVRRKAVSL